jgi:hypothetical protein
VSPVRYELGLYIPEDGITHSHLCETVKYYIALTGWILYWRRNVFPLRYELGFISQKKALFIFTASITSNLTLIEIIC